MRGTGDLPARQKTYWSPVAGASRGRLPPCSSSAPQPSSLVAALFEIGGAWLVWQGVREHRGWIWIGAGVIALGAYGFVATLQPDAEFGRILAAYGGVFVAGSLAWGMVADGYRPDRWDVIGRWSAWPGMALIMYAPRSALTPGRRPRDPPPILGRRIDHMREE